MKILVTGGGSTEPIDNVRAICNFSTGRTASFLADYFADHEHEVTAIMSEKAIKPQKAEIKTYKTFSDLNTLLEAECKKGIYHAFVHAAAVSDYSPDTIEIDGKIIKAGQISKVPSGSQLTIHMKKNPKLVDSLKEWSGLNTKVFAFKLTSNANTEERKAAVEKIFNANNKKELAPDYVVSNDKSEILNEIHPCTIYKKDGNIAGKTKKLEELAEFLMKIMEGKI